MNLPNWNPTLEGLKLPVFEVVNGKVGYDQEALLPPAAFIDLNYISRQKDILKGHPI
jgi:hypothetical protein